VTIASASPRLERLPDGAASSGAGGDHRHIRTAQAKGDRDVARGGVGQHVLDECRADPLEATLLEDALLFEEDPKSARRAPEDHAELVAQAILLQPGIGEGLLGGDQPELAIAVHPPELLGLDPAGRVEALHLTGDLNGKLAGVEERHLAHSGLAFQHGGPGAGRIETNRRHRPHAGHDDAFHADGEGVRTRATSRSLRVTTWASWLIRRISPDRT